jgi:hypothetical protein
MTSSLSKGVAAQPRAAVELEARLKVKRFALATIASIALLAAYAPIASASYAHVSGGWNSTPPIYNGPFSSDFLSVVPNNSYVRMSCWTDTQWYYVNYWSPRWFRVWSPWAREYWMHSSEVYAQGAVPHC